MKYGFLVLGFWFIIINIIGFNLMYKDKNSAENGGWRVRESVLFAIAFALGAISILTSMYVLRHKVRKYSFKYGLRVAIIENILIIFIVVLLLV